MKWTYSIKQKFTAATLLAVILLLTMLTNLLYRKHFKELEQSFSSIYEDRLLAESYLFHLFKSLKTKGDLLRKMVEEGNNTQTRAELVKNNKEESIIIDKYKKTYLSGEEKVKFNELTQLLSRINKLESEIMRKKSPAELPDLVRVHDEMTKDAFVALAALSDIQINEGTLLRNKSKKIILGSVSMSHFEMTILIIIAIVIQTLIFSSNTLKVKKSKYPSLN